MTEYDRILKQLSEKVVPKGTVKFINTKDTDPFVQSVLQDYADENNLNINDVNNTFKDELKNRLDYFSTAPIMNDQAIAGAVEQTLFDFLPKNQTEDINYKILMKNLKVMFTNIQAMNSYLFPMREGASGKILEPMISITPAPAFIKQADWLKGVTTAAASAQGDIIFNLDFAKKLIYYARKKGITPKGAMYEGNGGTIPDSYAYIEFLIMHELYHIIHADTRFYSEELAKFICDNKDTYPKILNQFGNNCAAAAGRMQNLVGDYITNYSLVKAGYEQLPIGLFSDNINYDRMTTMKDMWIAVMDEVEKQSPEADENQSKQMDDHMDSNNNNEKEQDDQQGSGKQDGQQADQDSQDGQQDGQDGQSDQDSQGGQQQDGQDGEQGNQSDQQQDGQDGQQEDGQDGEQGNQSDQQSGKDSQDGQQQDGQDGEQGNQSGKDSQDGQSDQQSDQDSQDGQQQDGQQGNQSGQGSQGKDSQDTKQGTSKSSEELEKQGAEAREELEKQAENAHNMSNEDIEKAKEKLKKQIQSEKAKELEDKMKDAKNRSSSFNVEFDKTYNPSFSWDKLVKKMMPSGEPTKEETFSKVSKKNPGGLKMLKDTGRGRAKAGEIDVDPESRDVVFVIDNSGSVMSVISKVNTEILKLVEKYGKEIDNFIIIKFDSNFEMWKVNIKDKTAQEITRNDINKIIKAKGNMKNIKPKDRKVPMKNMFDASSLGGGTEFDETIIKLMSTFMKKGASSILFTDTDIEWKTNATNVQRLIRTFGKVPFKFNIILKDKDSFDSFVKHVQGYKYLSNFNV